MPRRAWRTLTADDYFTIQSQVPTVIQNRAYIGSSKSPPPPPPNTPEDLKTAVEILKAKSKEPQGVTLEDMEAVLGMMKEKAKEREGPPPTDDKPQSKNARKQASKREKQRARNAQHNLTDPNTDSASVIGSRHIKSILGLIDDKTTPGTDTHITSSTDTTSASATNAQPPKLVLEASIPQSSLALHPSQPADMGNSKSSSAKKRNTKKARTSNDLPGNAPAATMTSDNNVDTEDSIPKSALEVAEQLNAEVAKMLNINTNTEHTTGNTQELTSASASEPDDNTLGPHILPENTPEVANESTTDTLTSGNLPNIASDTAKTASDDTITPGNMTKKASKKARQRAKKALAKQNANNTSKAAEESNDGIGTSSVMPDTDTHAPANVPNVGSASAEAPTNTTAVSDYVPNVDASLYPGFGELDLLLVEQCVDWPQAVRGDRCPAFLFSGLVEAKDQAGRDKVWEEWKERPALSSDPQLAAEINASGVKTEVAKPCANIHKDFSRIPKEVRTMMHEFSKDLPKTLGAQEPVMYTGEQMRAAILGADNGEGEEEKEEEETGEHQNPFN